MATDMLEAVRHAAAELDTDRRAWVIGVGRLLDHEDEANLDVEQVERVFAELYDSGDFPLGPLAYAADYQRVDVNSAFHMVTVEHHQNGEPYLESRMGFGIGGFVALGFTRSGILEASIHAPSHVLLVDVEAAISDITTLVVAVAMELDYRGPCAVAVGVVSDVADQTLRLRAYDPASDLRPADPSLDRFVPVVAFFDVGDTPDRAQFHSMSYRLAQQAAAEFGVEYPQLILGPRLGTPGPGESNVIAVNPFGAGSATVAGRQG